MYILTLIDLEEGLRQLAGEQGFWQISEVLLQHVRYIICRLALVADSSPVGAACLVHLTKSLDARFDSRLSEKANLEFKSEGRSERVTSCVHKQKPEKSALSCDALISLSISMKTMFDPVIKPYPNPLMCSGTQQEHLQAVTNEWNTLDLSPHPELTVNMITSQQILLLTVFAGSSVRPSGPPCSERCVGPCQCPFKAV